MLDWRTVFTIKTTEDLKSKDKLGSDCYLEKMLSQLEAKKRNQFSLQVLNGEYFSL